MDQPTSLASRLREGVTALRSGDRAAAHAIFRDLTEIHPDNENTWIGLALSSVSAEDAAGAIARAGSLNPTSRFVTQAKQDLSARLPSFASALAAAEGAGAVSPAMAETRPVPVTTAEPAADGAPANGTASDPVAAGTPDLAAGPRLGSGKVLEAKDPRLQRLLLNIGLTLLMLLVLGAAGYFLLTSDVFRGPRSVATLVATPTVPVSPPAGATRPVAVAVPTSVVTEIATQSAEVNSLPTTAPATATGTPADPERATALDAVRAGRYGDAIPALEAATERRPGDAEALYYLGIAYMGAPDRPHNLEDATLTFRSLQALEPRWAPGLDVLARSLIAQGQYRGAVTPAHQAVENDPSRAEYWITLARAYEGAGAKAEAAKAYAEAGRHSPPGAATVGPTAPSPTAAPPGGLSPTPGAVAPRASDKPPAAIGTTGALPLPPTTTATPPSAPGGSAGSPTPSPAPAISK